MAHLKIQSPQGSKRVELGSSKVTIGRHADNTLSLNDASASRFHCEIEHTPEGFLLRDLDSRNGTKMKGLSVVTVVLRPDAEFVIGKTTFRFVDEQAARVGASAAATTGLRGGNLDEAGPGAGIARNVDDTMMTGQDSGPVVTGPDFSIGTIDALSRLGKEVPFDVDSVAMINCRGEVVHEAADRGNTNVDAIAESIHLLRQLLLGCMRSSASDIHLEPHRDGGLIRLRIDGAMVEVAHIDDRAAKALANVIKVMGDIDFTKKADVQESHFSSQVPGRRIDYRISFTPSMFGQKLVVRVLDPESAPQRLRNLGLPDWMHINLRNLGRQDTGMLVVTGPTGSGKTTTLYAALRQIDAKLRNIVTIEDPIEYEVAGVTQMPVDDVHGHSFHSLLRSVLRQDPDVIVVGEIRDRETATTAMQAATTGHLVLTTVHAKDTIGTIFRLLDLGVEPYLAASTLNLILAQRLARRLCPHCKEARKPTPTQVMRLGGPVEGVKRIYTPAGCPRCFGTGYSGRRGIFELLTTTDELRDVILKSPDIASIRKSIAMTLFTSLRQGGSDMVLKGETSLAEVDRVLGTE